MNTPSHMILNLAILRRPDQVIYTWPILLGAIAPRCRHLCLLRLGQGGCKKLPESVIWREAYYSQPW